MISFGLFNIWLFLSIIGQISAISYNQPKFCPNATWNASALTFADSTTIGQYPFATFVDKNNNVYVSTQTNNSVVEWLNGSITHSNISVQNLFYSPSLFVTETYDIYADYGQTCYQNNNSSSNSTDNVAAMYVCAGCWGLFIDNSNNLYCSVYANHQVVSKSLNGNVSTWNIVGGTGVLGNTSVTLNFPRGIVVDTNLNLYVADTMNNRIQKFQSGQLTGSTIAGSGATGTITLNNPTSIIFDADGYLFIVDCNNHRIIGSDVNGFRCIAGCSGMGSTSTQLAYPTTVSFDNSGNLYITDQNNNRIQKFMLATNSCASATTLQTTMAQMTSVVQTATASTTMTSTTSQAITTTPGCFAPTITLIPGQSTLSSPLQYRKSDDFTISSMIQFNCNGLLSTITQWIIKNCTSTNCSSQIQLGVNVATTTSELYIPSKTLAYGTYELTLSVAMVASPNLKSSSAVYVNIIQSNIIVNLIQLQLSLITYGYDQDILFDPGTYSIDPDSSPFSAGNWQYQYYCRIYDMYNFPSIQGTLMTIDDSRTDPLNPSCLSNRSDNRAPLIYKNSTVSPNSSLTIIFGSLQTNRTYQFMIYMTNRPNPSITATGYLLVKIADATPKLIVVGCVLSGMCVGNLAYQLVNPTTQVSLYSNCIGNCTNIQSIRWNVYQGSQNSSSNVTQWTLFNQMNLYGNIWFFGTNTSNFTSTNDLFLNDLQTILWQFEAVYTFSSGISLNTINFIINQPPSNGLCTIDPSNGTITTQFTASCLYWYDANGIKDYTLYVWTTDVTQKVLVAFSPVSSFQVLLPAGDNQTSLLNMAVVVRDTLDCAAQYNMPSISVIVNSNDISDLINVLQNSSSSSTNNNQFVQILSSGNQNAVGQVVTSLSQQFNTMSSGAVASAVSSGIPAAAISVSGLGSTSSSSQGTSAPLNQSALNAYNQQLNSQANVRDYLMTFMTNLSVTTTNSIKLQASSIAQLTQAPNQLTRSALWIASTKCYQLAVALYSMAGTIVYEDVQTVADQLTQCIANVMTGVNGPLQQRTSVLDLDLARVSVSSSDYDSVDGNDLSLEIIIENLNNYYQQQLADDIKNQVTQTISLITASLKIYLNIGQNYTLSTSQSFMSLETIPIDSLGSKVVKQVGGAQFQIPSNFSLNITYNASISVRSTMEPLAPAGNSKVQSNTNLSTSISLSFIDSNGNEISVETDEDNPIQFFVPRDPNLEIPSMILQNVTSINSTSHNQLFYLQYVNITSPLSISIHFEMHPLNTNLSYLFIYKFDQPPQLNSTIHLIDGWTLFCPSSIVNLDLTDENLYKYFINNQLTTNHQSLVFGIRELNSTEMVEFCSDNSSTDNYPITDKSYNFTSNYELRIYTSGCYYLDTNNTWQSHGLMVGVLTNYHTTQCLATHLTTFAGGFIVLPAPINWSYVFANADFLRNKTVYFTIISISIVYILLMIYSRYKDRKDMEKLGVIPLPDNQKSDQYFYEIIVFTGLRLNAGTESKVQFVLSGDDDETPVRTLSDPHRKILQRGGIDAFIMAVPKSLGLLNYIRIWHDNTGEGSSAGWFLKYIIIRDLQTMEKFYFISQRWFSVEKDDGLIERVLTVAGVMERSEFSYVLAKKTYHSVSDGHLWFSIFSHPPSNKFTRVQRCTCCFVLLFITMLLNIMYYDLSAEANIANGTQTSSLSFGPFFITPEQIGIGVISEVLSLLPSLLIVQLFRRIRSRQQISPLRQILYKLKPSSQLFSTQTKNKSTAITLPWWCLFIAYGLSFIMIGISILFIIARGIEFGDLKTQKWLTSILTGIFSSILLTQPIKVVCMAIFFACFCRNLNDDKEASEYLDETAFELDNNEEYLHSMKDFSLFTSRSSKLVNRLSENEVAFARDQRLKELKMWSIIHEFATYVIYLVLISLITFSNRDGNCFLQVQHSRNYFFDTRQIDYDYRKITTINDFWEWLDNSFVPNIHVQQWYNGENPENLNGYINDKSNRLIGWATMRQLRIKSELCSSQRIISICEDDYSYFNEEKDSFQPGWTNKTSTYSSSILKAFQYITSDQLDTYIYAGEYATYSGNGYVYEFIGNLSDINSNLSQLHQLDWIDDKTRAIFIQLTLYNPNVGLFTSVTLLLEFLSSSGVFPSASFEPINFYLFTSLLQLVCTIIYICLIVYFMSNEIRLFSQLKLKYFYKFWSLVQLSIIGCSWGCIGVYVWRFHESNRISQLFKQTNGNVYINLQLAVYINDILTNLLGFCCFFGIIKFIHFCRFNHRLTLFSRTLESSRKELLSFSILFLIIYMAFLSLFYLLFNSKILSCSSLLLTAEMIFEMSSLKYSTSPLSEASAFLGPFCFSLFIFLVVFIGLSMFLSIIRDNFRRVRKEKIEHEEIFSFILKKFLRWTGLKKATPSEILEQQDSRMHQQFFDPIENFPDRIDQLLGVIDRLYIDQKDEISRLDKRATSISSVDVNVKL